MIICDNSDEAKTKLWTYPHFTFVSFGKPIFREAKNGLVGTFIVTQTNRVYMLNPRPPPLFKLDHFWESYARAAL